MAYHHIKPHAGQTYDNQKQFKQENEITDEYLQEFLEDNITNPQYFVF